MSSIMQPVANARQIAQWLMEARDGSDHALGHLFETFRPFLLSLARQRVRADIKHRLGFSDIVQDTYEDALKAFPRFDGDSEAELRAWLRRILLTNVAQSYAENHRQKRDIGVEVAFGNLVGMDADRGLNGGDATSSSEGRTRTQDAVLQQSLADLADDYREVIHLHNYERLTFAEAGERLGRSEDAVRKLWTRAIDRLRELLEAADASR